MRFKIDENLPVEAAMKLREAGYDALTIRYVALTLIALALLSVNASGADIDPDTVAAKVGEETISARQCEREVRRVARQLPTDPLVLEKLRWDALRACVDRAAALQQLVADQRAATTADVDLQIARMKKELAARDVSWEQHLASAGLSADEYRAEIRWGLSWDATLKRELTNDNLRKVFARSPREFDGTRLRAAHLLLKPAGEPPTAQNIAATVEEAQTIRQQIVAKKLSFAKAAQQYSQAPTAAQGGELGYIERRQPMSEDFSAAAFALEVGEVSAPVVSPAGVHLITCLEIVPGQRTMDDAHEEVRAVAIRKYFQYLARRRQREVSLYYSGDYAGAGPVTHPPAPVKK